MGSTQVQCHILVVEDEFIIASNIQRILQRIGHSVAAICNNSDEVEDIILRERPDLVLMDIEIDGKADGIVTAQMIQERYRIPVVYISGMREEEVIDRIPETQPFGFIAKPFTALELKVAVSIAMYKARTEDRLRRQEIQIQQLLEHMPQGFCLLDENGRLNYANQTLAEILGIGQENLREYFLSDFIPDTPMFFSLFGMEGGVRNIPPEFCVDPFHANIEVGNRKIPMYLTPRLIRDDNTGKLQGCFLSLVNIDEIETKIPPDAGKTC